MSARLGHDNPPDGVGAIPWPARFSDFDVLGHVNNAVYWAVVEEHLDLVAPLTVVLEYRAGSTEARPQPWSWTATACGYWPTEPWLRAPGSALEAIVADPVRRGLRPTPFD